MSYFEQYFNLFGQKTLRYYTRPINLARFDHLEWTWKHEGLERIEQYFSEVKQFPVLSAEMAAELSHADQLSLQAGLSGSDPAGLYQPVKASNNNSGR